LAHPRLGNQFEARIIFGAHATAVAQRRAGFFVINTHPEAFGFCPSQEGI
jgi:hypothetical protein